MPQTIQESATDIALEEPTLYQVILLNDDWTAMDFVVSVLVQIFEKSNDEAVEIMLKIHKEGSGVCGIYPYDIAELKAKITLELAKQSGYPLRVETKQL
ncbi:ATP-dependent Clp protease adaptor ClpS [Helicobacter sp. TUL]|uniref:ATP-dependent Clp protease adaptor ClpS n=1 Tax=Helicobacter sp. TUL TaxID=1848928 RepID=UPI000BAB57E3|nr:ATP-dependent Clp protease adaptor ClpS [Helicobacter sp. TUL]PAV00414.1 ATP-dependent Clp protease adaptor ClpS [Helicobacter sp. TUL]